MRWLALALLVACGGTQRPAAAAPRGVLVVRSPSSDAEVWLDDRLVAQVGRLPGGMRISAGPHRVELRREGFHTRYAEVVVEADATKVLELVLTEEQP